MDHQPSRTSIYHDLLDAFAQEGCPVCRLALGNVRGYLDSISREGGLTDLEIRTRLRESHAFCAGHALQWLESQHLLGTAILYEDLIIHLTGELKTLRHAKRGFLAAAAPLLGGGGRKADALEQHRACPACGVLTRAEARINDVLLEHLREEGFREEYARSGGVCLPHLRIALAAAPDEPSFRTLIEVAVARNEALVAHLREIIRLHDYRYSREPSGDERGADARAVRHVVGEPGVRGLGRDP
ncbi:MAG: DUF6062 family protein [Chloroflexota bacterium]|nr:DUF6062 family protein [Chloroflexota bacterium]